MNDELLACFDTKGDEIAAQPRSLALANPFPEYYHGVASIWLVDEKANILCSLRSSKVSENAGKWQSYFGGHVPSGLSFETTAIQELKQEVGLDVTSEELKLVEEGIYEPHKHFYKHYAVKVNPMGLLLSFEDQEIAETKWLSFSQYQHERESFSDRWCNGIELPTHLKIEQIVKNLL